MKIVNRFEKAVREEAIKGGVEPEDWSSIEKEYKVSKRKLLQYIRDLKKNQIYYGKEKDHG